MNKRRNVFFTLAARALALACLVGSGCQTTDIGAEMSACPLPRELAKFSLPPYRVAPPDILLIDALRVVPKPPYKIQPLDALFIQVPGAIDPFVPISGVYGVEPDGTVRLGADYPSIAVAGLTIEQADAKIEATLKPILRESSATVALAQFRGEQQIRGEHLVRPDGTVGLGTYGSVHVAGKTLEEVKAVIESHLSQFLLRPEVSVDVFAYNSKVYYIVANGGGFGDQVFRFPVTGNETVLDALSQINGVPINGSKHRIWIARPAPAGAPCDQILPVDWNAIVKRGQTATNYQVLPGDRIYVGPNPLLAADTVIGQIIAPMERIFGFTLLGLGTVQSFEQGGIGGFGGGFGGIGGVGTLP